MLKTILRKTLPPLALIILGLVAFLNSLPNSFHFDDYDAIVNNPAIRDLKHLPSYFTDTRTWTMSSQQDWRPMVLTTFALNYWMGGINPVFYRLTNLALHIGVAFFLFLIFKNIAARSAARLPDLSTRTVTWLALFAAGLFLVHTANSEIVNYIFARSTLLATFFYLAAFYCYLRGPFSGREQYSRLWHLAALSLFILAVCSKGSAVTLPLSLVVFEIIFLNPSGQSPWQLFKSDPGRLKKYLPLAILGFGYVAFRPSFARRLIGRVFTGTNTEFAPAYLYTQFRAWVYYMSLFFWPDPLIFDYPGFGLSSSLWEPRVLLSLALVLIILGIAWRLWQTAPVISFFIFWYFIVLLPEASFIPLTNLVSGYRPYPANFGLSIVFVVLVYQVTSWLSKKAGGEIRAGRRAAFCAGTAAILLCSLTVATIKRNEVWRDGGTLWRDVMRKDPTNPRAYMNLGVHLQRNGEYKQAEELIEKAVRMTPTDPSAFMLRALFSMEIGRSAAALEDLNRAIDLDGKALHAYYYRGELYRKMGDHEKALADYHSALKLRPLYTNALFGIAQVLGQTGQDDQAKAACEKMIQINSRDARAYSCLGDYFSRRMKHHEALAVYRKGTALLPKSPTLWYELGGVYEKLEMYKEAAAAFSQASSLLNVSASERAR
jgi:Tfp pilus assembly protein PilF